MVLHRILLQTVKRQAQKLIVNPIEVKHGDLAGSRDGWVYQADTVVACCAPRQQRDRPRRARRARLLPNQLLELPFHARETHRVVAISSGLCEGRGFEGMGASMISHRTLFEAVKRMTQERIVNSDAGKRWKLAGSRDGKVYRAGTVCACHAAWELRAFSSSARRARPLPDPVLELSRHARGTRCPIRPMVPFLQRGEVSGDEGAASEVAERDREGERERECV